MHAIRDAVPQIGAHDAPLVSAWTDATIPNQPMPKPFALRWPRLAAILVLPVLLAGCATPMPRKDDPYENFNRKMFAFNEFADRVAIRPVAVGYRKVTNETSRRLISKIGRAHV